MTKLSDIFFRHAPDAAPAGNAAEQQSGTASASGASGADLTLEYRDTPFTSFMRLLRDKIETDPKEAMRMVLNAKQAKIFTKAHEVDKIEKKLSEVVDALHREQPKGLAASFLRSVLDLARPASEARHPENPAPHLRPSFMAPALSLHPAPAII
jgi:hypothetical protein